MVKRTGLRWRRLHCALLVCVALLAGCEEETIPPEELPRLRTAVAATTTIEARLPRRVATVTSAVVVPTSTSQPASTPVPRLVFVTPTPLPAGPVVNEREYLSHWLALRNEMDKSIDRYYESWNETNYTDITLQLSERERLQEYVIWQSLPNRLRQVSPPASLAELHQLHLETFEQMAIAGREFTIAADPQTEPLAAEAARQTGDQAWVRFAGLLVQLSVEPLEPEKEARRVIVRQPTRTPRA